MRLARPAAIVFDFDLTLVNSTEGFVACHGYAAGLVGLTPPTRKQVSRSIGTPLPVVFARFYSDEHADVRDAYLEHYQAHADEVMTDLTVFLDGSRAALDRLASAGIPLGIVSQKLRYRVDDVLKRGDALDTFRVVLGGDDVAALKPDPAGLLEALNRLDVPPAEAMYVGDTTIDAETAARAGTPFVAVLTGFTTADEFKPFVPAATLDSVGRLPDLLGVA